MKIKTPVQYLCWILTTLMPLFLGHIYAQTLDEVLGAGKTDYKQAKPETIEKWENILTMLDASRFEAALPELQKYRTIDDVTEPYQKVFVDSVIILIEPGDQFMRADDVQLRYNKSIDNLKKDKADLLSENMGLEAQLPAIEKKIMDAATGEGVGNAVGGMLGLGSVGQISKAGKEGAERELSRIKEKINKNETQIAQIDTKIEKLKLGQEDEVTKLDSEFQDQQKVLREKISTQIKELTKMNHSRTAAVLANVYMRKRGNDVEIGKLAQQATENLKNESKAIEVAKVALKPVREMMDKMKLWTAKSELEKAFATIKNRISDNSLTELISREVMMVKYELDEKLKKVNDEIGNSMDLAKEDPVQAESKLMVLKKTYVDDPNLEQKINEVRTTRYEKEEKTILRLSQTDPEAAERKLSEFVDRNPEFPNSENLKIKVKEIKFAKRISAIEEVISNDPAEAKKMIKTLMASGLTPDDISVVKSKVSKLERQILDKEFDGIKADMDEAQGFLTKFNAQVAGSGNVPTDGKIVKVDFISSLSIGTENIVRARSIQVGAQKRLEILLVEPMDNVTKAKLTGLLETQKAAVEQMDEVANLQRNNRILAVAGCGVILMAGGFGGLVLKKRFKKQ